MTGVFQHLRNTTAELAGYAGALAELRWDSTKKTWVGFDGATAGGFPMLREDLGNLGAALDFTGKTMTGVTLSGTTALPGGGQIAADGRLGIGVAPIEKVSVLGNVEVRGDAVPAYVWFHDPGSFSWSLGHNGADDALIVSHVQGVGSARIAWFTASGLGIHATPSGGGIYLSQQGATSSHGIRTTQGTGDVRLYSDGTNGRLSNAGLVDLTLNAANGYLNSLRGFVAQGAVAGFANDIAGFDLASGNMRFVNSAVTSPKMTFYAGQFARELLELLDVASAVNHWSMSPSATGNKVLLQVAGDDTNAGAMIILKGNENLQINGYGSTSGAVGIARFSPAANAVQNGIHIVGAISGNPPTMYASDLGGTGNVNIDLRIVPAGAGVLDIFGTAATAAAAPANFSAAEYLPIKVNGVTKYLPLATATW